MFLRDLELIILFGPVEYMFQVWVYLLFGCIYIRVGRENRDVTCIWNIFYSVCLVVLGCDV